MQWVVITGPTVAEAKARALDALGIDEVDLDWEVEAEPSRTLFGLRTTDARIRARVRPTKPRPKVDRRNRRTGRGDKRAGGKRRRGRTGDADPSPDQRDGERSDRAPASVAGGAETTPAADATDATTATDRPEAGPDPERPAASSSRRAASDAAVRTDPQPARATRGRGSRGAPMSDIPLETQEPTALDFVRGLVDAFDVDADVHAVHEEDDDAIEIRVEGDDLGLLVGPRGATLSAIAELTRTAVAQQHAGRLEGRLRVDVAGYRARRKEALIRFAGQIADRVLDSGEAVALEPMSPPDRKIVHDAVNEIDGVHTTSRGEDRRRHVVIQPDD